MRAQGRASSPAFPFTGKKREAGVERILPSPAARERLREWKKRFFART
jgi:hypothetical protein